jgi:hypothetical protein
MNNKINNYTAYFLIAICLLCSCSNTPKNSTINEDGVSVISNPQYGEHQQNEAPPLSLQLVTTFSSGETSGVLLSDIESGFTTEEGALFIFDNDLNKLIRFNSTGEVSWAKGTEGEGPGDFEGVNSIAWDGNQTIYIANNYGSRIDRYDLDGNYIESLNLENQIGKKYFSIEGFLDDQLVLSTANWGEFSRTFYLMNIENSIELIRSFTFDLSGEMEIPPSMNEFSKVKIIDNQLVVPDLLQFRYFIYNSDSTLVKQIDRETDWIVAPGFFRTDDDEYIGTFSRVRPLFDVGKYYIGSAYWPENVKESSRILQNFFSGNEIEVLYKNTLDIYSQEHTLLYSFISEGETNSTYGTPFLSDQSFVYTIHEETNPEIRKYKIIPNDQ